MTAAAARLARFPLCRVPAWAIVTLALGISVYLAWPAGDLFARTLVAGLALGLSVVVIASQDRRTYTIPDAAVLSLAVMAVAWRWAVADRLGTAPISTMLEIGFDALLPGGALFALREIYYRRKGFDAIGFGDVKLAAAGGLLVGTIGFSWALFVSSFSAFVVIGVSRLLPNSHGKSLTNSDKIAFGAILAPAIWLVWIAQQTTWMPQGLG